MSSLWVKQVKFEVNRNLMLLNRKCIAANRMRMLYKNSFPRNTQTVQEFVDRTSSQIIIVYQHWYKKLTSWRYSYNNFFYCWVYHRLWKSLLNYRLKALKQIGDSYSLKLKLHGRYVRTTCINYNALFAMYLKVLITCSSTTTTKVPSDGRGGGTPKSTQCKLLV